MANLRRTHRGGTFLRGGKSVRETMWIGITEASNVIAAANTAIVSSSLSAAALALRPFTVVRTRGVLHLISDQLAATEFQGVVFALAVVSDQARAIGVTAVPTGVVDRGSDLFFVYEELINTIDFGDATGFQSSAGIFKDFDSKAMRKVNDDQDIVVTKETYSIGGGVSFTSAGRMLIKLH